MNESANRTAVNAARAELAAAGFTVTPAGAARARARRLATVAAFPPGRRRAVRRRVFAAMQAERPAGDAARHPAA